MKKIELEIVALSHSITQSQSYAVVLGEVNGARRLPIVIGGTEAQAIAVAMENMTPGRPLTHDLMRNICQEFEIELKEVIISNLLDGIYYARLICFRGGEITEIDSRTSDALALAVRFNCPIYTYESIMEQAGIILEEPRSSRKSKERERREPVSSKSSSTSVSTGWEKESLERLNTLLDDAIKKEDYERAARIRDEINKRD